MGDTTHLQIRYDEFVMTNNEFVMSSVRIELSQVSRIRYVFRSHSHARARQQYGPNRGNSLSLSLSLSHTHTHKHTTLSLSLFLSLSHVLYRCLFDSLPAFFSLIHFLALSLSLSPSYTHTPPDDA